MSIFSMDETAWSALTKALEAIAGNPGSPLIVQAPTVFQPLSIQQVNPNLAMFRKLLVGDKIPAYGNKNPNNYISTGKSVALGYHQFLQQLNDAFTEKFVPIADREQIKALLKAYQKDLKAQNDFIKAANADWKRKKAANPRLTRIEWDRNYGDYGYTAQLQILQDDVATSYGEYKAKAAAYPALDRVRTALANMDNNPAQKLALPTTEDDLQYPEAWDPFYKTNMDVDWRDFFGHDASYDIQLSQNSATSSHYESSWSAGGGVSWGFFSVGGSASGGHIEDHFRSGTQDMTFSFKRLIPATIVRGSWYDEGILTPYVSWVDKNEYWGRSGTLNIIPIRVLIARGLSVKINTSLTAYDAFQDWYRRGGSGGFSFGPFAVGISGGSSTSSNSVSNTSSGTTVKFDDNSGQVYVLAVVSNKMDEYLANRTLFRAMGRAEFSEFERASMAWQQENHPQLFEVPVINERNLTRSAA
jgi:hypothetical protein